MLTDNEIEKIKRNITEELIRRDPIWLGAVDSVSTNHKAKPRNQLDHPLGMAQLPGMIDHTLLKPDATQAQIAKLCAEALQYKFASVCVNPTNVPQCVSLLHGSSVKVSTVVGFPLGATFSQVKAEEARQALEAGASEIDMVINIGALRSGAYDYVVADIQEVVRAALPVNAVVKVIIETCLLTEEEKVAACVLAKLACVDFVKTSTGFSGGGATVEDVKLMRRVVGDEVGVKAAGGIRTLEDAQMMIIAGATRLGTSAGIKIVTSLAQVATTEDNFSNAY
jgi:deoxyribose-phosphate aldolase